MTKQYTLIFADDNPIGISWIDEETKHRECLMIGDKFNIILKVDSKVCDTKLVSDNDQEYNTLENNTLLDLFYRNNDIVVLRMIPNNADKDNCIYFDFYLNRTYMLDGTLIENDLEKINSSGFEPVKNNPIQEHYSMNIGYLLFNDNYIKIINDLKKVKENIDRLEYVYESNINQRLNYPESIKEISRILQSIEYIHYSEIFEDYTIPNPEKDQLNMIAKNILNKLSDEIDYIGDIPNKLKERYALENPFGIELDRKLLSISENYEKIKDMLDKGYSGLNDKLRLCVWLIDSYVLLYDLKNDVRDLYFIEIDICNFIQEFIFLDLSEKIYNYTIKIPTE